MADFTVYSNDPVLLAAGATPYSLRTRHWWYERDFSTDPSGPYITEIHSVARTRQFLSPNTVSPITIDLETFDISSPTGRANTFIQMKSAVDTARAINAEAIAAGSGDPVWEIGWYASLPVRQLFAATNFAPADPDNPGPNPDQRWLDWMAINEANLNLFAPLFDHYQPSLYYFNIDNPNLDHWKRYADNNIRECRYVPKGIRPWIWPRLAAPNSTRGVGDLSYADWTGQLRHLANHPNPNVEGVYIFDLGDITPNWQVPVIEEMLFRDSTAAEKASAVNDAFDIVGTPAPITSEGTGTTDPEEEASTAESFQTTYAEWASDTVDPSLVAAGHEWGPNGKGKVGTNTDLVLLPNLSPVIGTGYDGYYGYYYPNPAATDSTVTIPGVGQGTAVVAETPGLVIADDCGCHLVISITKGASYESGHFRWAFPESIDGFEVSLRIQGMEFTGTANDMSATIPLTIANTTSLKLTTGERSTYRLTATNGTESRVFVGRAEIV